MARPRHKKWDGAPEGVYRSLKADGKWTYEARHPVTKLFYVGGPLLTDAKRLRAKFVQESSRNEVTGNPRTRIEQLIPKFLDQHATQVKPTSMAKYEQVIRLHIEPWWGKVMVRDITRGAVTGWLASLDLADTGLVRAVFALIVDVACDERMVTVNYVREAKQPKRTKPKKESYALSVEELDRLIGACPDWLRPVAEVAYGQALRIGEPAGLSWEQIDFRAGTLTIDRQLYRDGTYGPPKGNKAATIPLTEQARDLLLPMWVAAGQPSSGSVFGFSYRSIEEGFRRVVKKAGPFGGPVSFHSLRHTKCSMLAAQGVDMARVAKFARHASLKTTQQFYIHVVSDAEADDALRRAA